MARESQRCETLLPDNDSQFLFQLTNQTLFRSFTRLDLAAGKFPQARHRSPGGTLRDQHALVSIDESAGGDENDLDAHDLIAILAGPWLMTVQLSGALTLEQACWLIPI